MRRVVKHDGDIKRVYAFLFFGLSFDNVEERWLEWAYVEYERCNSGEGFYWVAKRFLTEEEYKSLPKMEWRALDKDENGLPIRIRQRELV